MLQEVVSEATPVVKEAVKTVTPLVQEVRPLGAPCGASALNGKETAPPARSIRD